MRKDRKENGKFKEKKTKKMKRMNIRDKMNKNGSTKQI